MSSTDYPFCNSLYLRSPLSSPSSASSAMSHTRQGPCIPTSEACSPAQNNKGKYYAELWQACAGPLVSLPKLKQLVMYLPQGHSEQISAASAQHGWDGELPKHDLDPHIPCRVMDIQLSAEPETDEVKAQLSLLPVHNEELEKESPPAAKDELQSSGSSVYMFCKTLTASDTSTHGGFSVPRKHASCLPPLDMSRFPPTQDLEATDLHGVKWRFRHIYRGQPKRHLLTTGWSVFVSQKRLAAGDAVIFLRGEDGELRVGVRRALRHQNKLPPSVLPSPTMQMGVIATASHAKAARTMFSVYYTPRVSPAEFIVPWERFKSSTSVNLSVGMRFKMRFETEDGSERRYNGTVTGIDDFDPIKWPNSKWRSLKVGWDEPTIFERHDRVSPWEIEICVNTISPPNPAPGPRYKRVRANIPAMSSAAEHSLVSSGKNKAGFRPNLSTVLQGQEPRTLGSFEDTYHHSLAPSCLLPSSQLNQSQSNRLPSIRQPWSACVNKQENGEVFWGISGQDSRGTYPIPSFVTSQLQHRQQLFLAGTLPLTDGSDPAWLLKSARLSTHTSKTSSTGMSTASTFNQSAFLSSTWQKKDEESEPAVAPMATRAATGVLTGCKLFGFSLTDPPPTKHNANIVGSTMGEKQGADIGNPIQLNDSELDLEQPSAPDVSTVSFEPEKLVECGEQQRDGQAKAKFGGRSCTKVIKKGSIVGRGVDLSKLGGYEQLFDELERMFQLQGQLRHKANGWQVAYSDSEDDMLEVGDDPWGEFCTMARKIHILSREEVAQGSSSSKRSNRGSDQ